MNVPQKHNILQWYFQISKTIDRRPTHSRARCWWSRSNSEARRSKTCCQDDKKKKPSYTFARTIIIIVTQFFCPPETISGVKQWNIVRAKMTRWRCKSWQSRRPRAEVESIYYSRIFDRSAIQRDGRDGISPPSKIPREILSVHIYYNIRLRYHQENRRD